MTFSHIRFSIFELSFRVLVQKSNEILYSRVSGATVISDLTCQRIQSVTRRIWPRISVPVGNIETINRLDE